MKINSSTAYGIYKANTKKPETDNSFQNAMSSLGKKQHTDKISISSEGARQLEIDKVSKSILDEIQTPAPTEKLEQLKAAVQNGSYHIATGDLADALMQRWLGL